MRQLSRRLRDQPGRLKIVNRESRTVSGAVNGKSKPIRSCEGGQMIVEVLRRVNKAENWMRNELNAKRPDANRYHRWRHWRLDRGAGAEAIRFRAGSL